MRHNTKDDTTDAITALWRERRDDIDSYRRWVKVSATEKQKLYNEVFDKDDKLFNAVMITLLPNVDCTSVKLAKGLDKCKERDIIPKICRTFHLNAVKSNENQPILRKIYSREERENRKEVLRTQKKLMNLSLTAAQEMRIKKQTMTAKSGKNIEKKKSKEQRQIEHQKRMEEQKKIKEQKQIEHQKRMDEQKAIKEQKRIERIKRMEEQKRYKEERRKKQLIDGILVDGNKENGNVKTLKPKIWDVKPGPPISSENKGYLLLQKMGWNEGEKIGVNDKGLSEPISVKRRAKNLGLGAQYQ